MRIHFSFPLKIFCLFMVVNNTPSPWPEDYGVAPDHCADVLAGSYDVPLQFATPPVVIDLGANVGAFAKWAAGRWPGALIHCYEPHPKNFALLCRTVAALPIPDLVTCRNVAVSDRAGKMALYAGQYNCGEWSLAERPGAEMVEVDVIDARDLPRGDILKIDTEGAEVNILWALSQAKRLAEFSAIMIECHNGAWVEPLIVRVCEAGFALHGKRVLAPHRHELKWLRLNWQRAEGV